MSMVTPTRAPTARSPIPSPRPARTRPTTEHGGPIRTCIGCRRRAPQRELVRVARREDASLAIGRSLEGRGAWLCAGSTSCARVAADRRAYSRAFRGPVSPSAIEALVAAIEQGAPEQQTTAFVPAGTVRDTGRPVSTGQGRRG